MGSAERMVYSIPSMAEHCWAPSVRRGLFHGMILVSPPGAADKVKQAAKGILGEKGVSVLKALAKR